MYRDYVTQNTFFFVCMYACVCACMHVCACIIDKGYPSTLLNRILKHDYCNNTVIIIVISLNDLQIIFNSNNLEVYDIL